MHYFITSVDYQYVHRLRRSVLSLPRSTFMITLPSGRSSEQPILVLQQQYWSEYYTTSSTTLTRIVGDLSLIHI